MVDKINNPAAPQPRRPDTAGSRVTAGTASDNSSKNNPVPNTPNVGNEAPVRSTFEQLQASVGTDSGVDMDKVAAIKSAIARGEYTIDAQRVSRAMMDLEQILQA